MRTRNISSLALVAAALGGSAGCRKATEGLIVVTVTADAPVVGISSFHATLTRGGAQAELDVRPAGGQPFDVPPNRTFAIRTDSADAIDIALEARDAVGTALANGTATAGAAIGRKETVTITLRAGGGGDGGMDVPPETPGEPGVEGRDGGMEPMPDVVPDLPPGVTVKIASVMPPLVGLFGKSTVKWNATLSAPGMFQVQTSAGKTVEEGPLAAGAIAHDTVVPASALDPGKNVIVVTVALTPGGPSAKDTASVEYDNDPPFTYASPGGGAFSEEIEVTLTVDDPAAVVRYTRDDSLVTMASPVYMAPLKLGPTPAVIVLRFRAWDPAGNTEFENRETYRFGDPPAVTGASPMTGEPGTAVTITGTGLGSVILVLFGGSNGVAGRPTSFSPTAIKVLVPPDAAPGPIAIRNVFGDTLWTDPGSGEGFKVGNCIDAGFDTDVIPDPGDPTLPLAGPWLGAVAVPSRSGREIRFLRNGYEPWGRMDLSDLPDGGAIHGAEYLVVGAMKEKFAVLRSTDTGSRVVSYVNDVGGQMGETAIDGLLAADEAGRGIAQITGGPDAGKLAVLTTARVHIVDLAGAETRSFTHGCKFPSGISAVFGGLRKDQLAVACGVAVQFFKTDGTGAGTPIIDNLHQNGISSLPGVGGVPEALIWISDDPAAHERKLHFQLLDGTEVDAVDASGHGASAPRFMGLATIFDGGYGATELAAVQSDRIVRFGFDGSPGAVTKLGVPAEPLGAAVVNVGPGADQIALLEFKTQTIRLYFPATGLQATSFPAPDAALAPLEGLMFFPGLAVRPKGGFFGVLGSSASGSSPFTLSMKPQVSGEAVQENHLLPGSVKQSVTYVPADPSDPSSSPYVAFLDGRTIEFRDQKDLSMIAAIKVGCQIDHDGEIAATPDRKIIVFDYPDGRIDFIRLADEGL